MGIYMNPENGSFRQAVRSRIYVDKTGLLEELNKLIGSEEKCVSLSHARRFGKSQAAGMIDAYYGITGNSEELFSKYEIAKKPDFKEHLNRYNVIHIDVSSILDFHKEDLVQYIIFTLYDDFKAIDPQADYGKTISSVLMQIYRKTGRTFVIILDEWDCVIRNCSDHPDLVHRYLQFLHALFKSEESKSYLALAYITGILPIKKMEDESALNNFIEYTMIQSDEMTPFFGFTEDEVKELCQKYRMDYESMQKWYNGYTISGQHMYNPNSVYMALVKNRFDSYWRNTSAFSTINYYIEMNYDGLKEDILTMLSGENVTVDVTTFQNDLSAIQSKDDVITALIHLGYLGFDSDTGTAYIPNYEVATAYKSALKNGSWREVARTVSRCEELLNATLKEDEKKVAEIVELAHEAYSSIIKYNDENSLSCVITMAYFTAPLYYNIIRELPTGKGFADLAMIPRNDSKGKPAILVELKWDKNADTAIRQMKEKRYVGNLQGFSDQILLVGINYDKISKKHECCIERVL